MHDPMKEYLLFYPDGRVEPYSGMWLPDTAKIPRKTLAYYFVNNQWYRIGWDAYGSWWCMASDQAIPKEYKVKLLLLT